jgi:DNA-directed RNA polymerase specialized sigma24 family protein
VADQEHASIARLERLYEARFHQYLRVAEAIAGDPDAGLDAVQEGFARAIRSLSDFRGEADLSTWVWRCVVNAAYGTRRAKDIATSLLIPLELYELAIRPSLWPRSSFTAKFTANLAARCPR